MGTAARPANWRTSSFSSNGTDCVEVSDDLTAVRDSKNPDGPMLAADFHRFVTAVKHGQLAG